MASPQAELWCSSMKEELTALGDMKTYRIMKRIHLPPGCHVIPARWVYRTKRGLNGEITRYKSRFVAKGFRQREGIDYTDTFASTAMGDVWKALLCLAAVNDWEVYQIDVVTAFLNPDIDVPVYVSCPEGTESPDGSPIKEWMCQLNKSLYGLKQSPHLWQSKLRAEVAKFGYFPLELDTAIYFNAKDDTYLVTHVDDFLLIGPKAGVSALRQNPETAFNMVPLGDASFFVGVRIVRDRAKRTISLFQDAFIDKILTKFSMHDCAAATTPMETGQHLVPFDGQATEDEIELYASMVGSAMYAATQTRPDISYVMTQPCRFLANPSPIHLAAVRRLYRYFRGTIFLGLMLGQNPDNLLDLHGYTDSDYAQDPVTRRSQGGYVFFLKGGCFSWKSYTMKRVTDSSTMPEVFAMKEAGKQAAFLSQLFASLNYTEPDAKTITVYYDNQPGYNQAKGQGVTGKSKHYAVPIFMLRELIADGVLKMEWVAGTGHAADGFTKALSPELLKGFVRMLMMCYLHS